MDLFSGIVMKQVYALAMSILSVWLSSLLNVPAHTILAQEKEIMDVVTSTTTAKQIQKQLEILTSTKTKKQSTRVTTSIQNESQPIAPDISDGTSTIDTATDDTTARSVAPSARTYEVTEVVDGDTIKVLIGQTVETLRIIGINTPETVDPRRPVGCFGKEASTKAKELLSGKTVALYADDTQDNRDKYQRLLRYVFVDGTDYGLWMIQHGYAYEYTYHVPYFYQTEYKNAQRDAKAGNDGLWSPSTCNGTS